MKLSSRFLVILFVSFLAGLGDALAGVSLLAVPDWTLSFFQTTPPMKMIFIRYLGVFVGMVGVTYFYGLITSWRRGEWQTMRTVWEISALFRIAVAIFLSFSVGFEYLPFNWTIVVGVDLAWATIQTTLILRGIFTNSANKNEF